MRCLEVGYQGSGNLCVDFIEFTAFTVVLSGVLLPVLSSVLDKRTGKRTVNFDG